MKSGVTLLGETNLTGDPTAVLDGQAWARIMTGADLDSTTVIENIRFAWGDTTGVSASGGALSLDNSALTLRNCGFSNNTADVGGAVDVNGGSPTFDNCYFDSNEGYDSAGAVAIRGGAVVLFDECSFYGNQASSSAVGGAVSCYSSSIVTFDGCWMNYNSCTGDGGVVYAHSSQVSMQYCVITNNSATLNGGVASGVDATFDIDYCTISTNIAPTTSGIRVSGIGSATIENTIIVSGVVGAAVTCSGGATASVYCCDIYGNTGGNYVGCLAGQYGTNGNISEDPMFCPGGEGSSYELSQCSPCASASGCGQIGALGVGCGGRWWWVPDDAPTIAAAIDSASFCDTVYVQADTYYEHDIVMKDGVYLLGEEGSGGVTIDALGLGRVFYCYEVSSTTVIDNFEIVNGETLGFGRGGGMRITNSEPWVRNCELLANYAYEGGAVQMDNAIGTRFTNCTFQDNQAVGSGGAVQFYDSWPTFENCSFQGNMTTTVGAHGGAMHAGLGSKAWITDCEFFGNETDQSGGAVYADACTLVVVGSLFGGNETTTEAAIGGAVSLTYAKASFDQCTFSDNGSYYGAQMFVEGGGYTPVTIDQSIFSFGVGGAAVECSGTPELTLTCSDVYGNTGGDYVDCLAGLGSVYGNLSVDPEFCRPESLNFHLSVGSPLIDAPGCGQVGALGAGCGYSHGVPSEYATIQEAIDAAAYGDTIVVECGTYYEEDITLADGVHIRSETGEPDCVTLVSGGADRIFYGNGVEDASITGLTLKGEGPFSDYAQGIYLLGSEVAVENCVFRALNSAYGGGAVLLDTGGLSTFTTCVFDSCTSYGDGGAVQVWDAGGAFTNCVFDRGSANYDGGAIDLMDGALVTVESSTFNQNYAGSGGSAIAAVSDMLRAAAVCTVRNSIIAYGTNAGATYCAGSGSVTLE